MRFQDLIAVPVVAVGLSALPAMAQLPEPAGGAVEEVCDILGACAGCNADLDQCESDLATCGGNLSSCDADRAQLQSDLMACDGSLSTCDGERTQCQSSLAACNADLASCESGLGACQACGDGNLDGGEQCDVAQLGGADCASATGGASPGGELRCGPGCTFDTSGCTVRFVDNGDGTVTDNQTGLMWEKKTTDGSIHDVGNFYSWSSCLGCTAPDGTAFTTFLTTLNAGGVGVGNCVSSDGITVSGGFAGHCDWRLPQIDELRSIVDCSHGPPCVDSVFGPAQGINPLYWSASTLPSSDRAWGVQLFFGDAQHHRKGGDTRRIIAVRGGSD